MIDLFPFSSQDKGVLHKSVVFEGEVHIVEEIQLLKNSESIKNLLLSTEVSDVTAMVCNCIKIRRWHTN